MSADWSAIDAPFIIRTGSALLYALAGAGILALRPRRRQNALLACILMILGVRAILTNFEAYVFGGDIPLVQGPLRDWLDVDGLVFILNLTDVVLLVAWTQGLMRSGKRAVPPWVTPVFILLALAAAAIFAIRTSPYLQDGTLGPSQVVWSVGFFLASVAVAYATVGAAETLRAGIRRAGALTLVVFALAVGRAQSTGVLLLDWSSARFAIGDFAQTAVLGLISLAWLLRAVRGPHSAVAWRLLLTFLLACTLGALRGTAEPGPFYLSIGGLLRILGVAAIAWAVLRMDFLGIAIPAWERHAGALAALFLLVLFAVAQVLENAVGGPTGLGIGAAVALASVFIGPRIERLAQRRLGRHDADEEAYRDAVRAAGRDKRFTPEEERALMVLASRLGISAERAYAIRDEVKAASRRQGGA